MIYAPHILVAIIKDSKSSQLVVTFPLANTTFLFGICRFERWTHCVRLHYEWNLPTFTKDLGILITFLPRFWIAAASDLALLLLLPPLTSSNSNPSPSWQFHFDGIHLVWLWLHKFGAVCDRDAMRCHAVRFHLHLQSPSGTWKCGSAVFDLGAAPWLWTSPYVITITATSNATTAMQRHQSKQHSTIHNTTRLDLKVKCLETCRF